MDADKKFWAELRKRLNKDDLNGAQELVAWQFGNWERRIQIELDLYISKHQTLH